MLIFRSVRCIVGGGYGLHWNFLAIRQFVYPLSIFCPSLSLLSLCATKICEISLQLLSVSLVLCCLHAHAILGRFSLNEDAKQNSKVTKGRDIDALRVRQLTRQSKKLIYVKTASVYLNSCAGV